MAKKERIGIVLSCASLKTISVEIQIRYQHEKYAKTLIKTKRYMAHDQKGVCIPGDIVCIEECSPISRHKTWTVKEILKSSCI